MFRIFSFRSLVVVLGAVVALTHSNAQYAGAIYNVNPPNQPGFPVTLAGYAIQDSSPTLADLDGDGKKEIIIGGRDLNGNNPGCGGYVYAYHSDGTLYWSAHVRAPVQASPTVADLNGDGKPEVIVGMGGWVDAQCWNGGVVALNGQTGAQLWLFDTQDWLNQAPDGMKDGVWSSPVVADLDGDGVPEIAFGAWDQCIYLLNNNGVPLWGNLPGILPLTYCGGHGFYLEDTSWSSPAVADVDGDGKLEIIIGADISPGNVYGDPAGGYIFVFKKDGTVLARKWIDQVVYSSPAVADLDKDGKPEIIVGTGTYWNGTGYYVNVFNYDGAQTNVRNRLVQKWRLPTAGRVFSSPAIGDLNLDGYKDIVVTSYIGNDGANGEVWAWSGRDGSLLWHTVACDEFGNSFAVRSSPTIADIYGDNYPEVLFSHSWEVSVLNHDGTYYTDYSGVGPVAEAICNRTSAPTTNMTYWTGYSVFGSPAVGDLDNNGQAEVVIGGAVDINNPNQGRLYVWTGHKDGAKPWPMFHHDAAHSGRADSAPPTNPSSFTTSPPFADGPVSIRPLTVQWSVPGVVAESGLMGYVIAWDRSADTQVGTTINLPATSTSTTTNAVSAGTWYFHIRAVDGMGNAAVTTAQVGPFVLVKGPYSTYLPLVWK